MTSPSSPEPHTVRVPWVSFEAYAPPARLAIAVPVEDLRALFDVATNSPYLGSGCVDTDEVDAMRRIAVLLGVNPAAAVPRTWIERYPHTAEPYTAPSWPGGGPRDGDCVYCNHGPDHQIHNTQPTEPASKEP